jgi:hypothetical protein
VLYDPNAEAPIFHKFIREVVPDDEVRIFLQRFFGYCLTGSTKEQAILMLWGEGSNGKSTLVDLLNWLLGDYALVTPFASLLHTDQRRGGEPTPDLARMPGARLVSAAEPETGARFAESMLKQLTGGEKMTVRHLRQDFFEFKPQFKLCLSFNNKPYIRGQDEGIWRRLLLVPFNQRFVDADRLKENPGALPKIKDLDKKLHAERIRDKIAASKRKGMWMGGTVPLGYDVANRSLVINQEEAEKVRLIFQRYLELKSTNELYKYLKSQNIKSKARILPSGEVVPGINFNRTSLHYLLTNQTYIGKTKHKEMVHDGNHEPIISMDLWDQVQTLLMSQAPSARGQKKIKEKNPLRGLLFNTEGFQYLPTYTNKPGRQYRYYQVRYSDDVAKRTKDALYRVPAHEIETRVEKAIRAELSDLKTASALLNIPETTGQPLLHMIAKRHDQIAGSDLLMDAVKRV